MRKEMIEMFIKSGQLRVRYPDKERIKSMISSAEINANVIKGIPANDNSATVIFREIYESIRQLGDAKWWIMGFEPLNHEVSLEVLKETDIKEKVKLNFLNRFKKIRNDANYRGFRVSVSQVNEILDFWNKCSRDIITILSKELKK